MTDFILLGVDLGDIVPIVIIVLSVVGWIIQQINAKAKEAAQHAPPPRPEPLVAMNPPEDEIDAFLRRAAERRGAAPHEPWVPVEVVEAAPTPSVTEHVRKHLDTSAFSARAQEITRLETVDEQLEERLQQVFDHKLGQLTQRSSSLPPAEPQQVSAPAAGPALVRGAAADIAEMLAHPNGARNAVVLQEVLRRPEW
jgi:hypothetical protein